MGHYNSTKNLFQIWNRFSAYNGQTESRSHLRFSPATWSYNVGHLSVTNSCCSQHFKEPTTLELFNIFTSAFQLAYEGYKLFSGTQHTAYLIYLAKKLAFASGGFSTESPDVAHHFVYSKLESLGSYRIKLGFPCKYWFLPVWATP